MRLTIAALLVAGCGAAAPQHIEVFPVTAHEGTIWFVETVTTPSGRGSVMGTRVERFVVMCREDRTPPCARFQPAEPDDAEEWRAWRATGRPLPAMPTQAEAFRDAD